MVLKRQIVYPARTGDEERWAYLYLPKMYDWEPERRFPVLYMFDGHNVFFDSDATYGKSWGMAEYLDSIDAPLIVSAIECSHSPDFGRLREYAPYNYTDPVAGKLPGYGEDTMKWLINTFKPETDSICRTIPDREHTWIAGSSMGGLMSIYAVLKHNDVFSRGAGLSPSLWASRKRLLTLIDNSDVGGDTVLYMDYGSQEFDTHPVMREVFGEITCALMQKGIFVTSRVIPDGSHSEASWERQLPFAIGTLLFGK